MNIVARQTSLTSRASVSRPVSSKRKNSFRPQAFQFPLPPRSTRDEPPNADSPIQSRLHRQAEFQAPTRAAQPSTPLESLQPGRDAFRGALSLDWQDPLDDISKLGDCFRLAVYWPLRRPSSVADGTIPHERL